MSEIYLDKHYKVAVKLDTENELLFMYDLNNGEIEYASQGILSTVNRELGTELEKYFNIDLIEYGVEYYDDRI